MVHIWGILVALVVVIALAPYHQLTTLVLCGKSESYSFANVSAFNEKDYSFWYFFVSGGSCNNWRETDNGRRLHKTLCCFTGIEKQRRYCVCRWCRQKRRSRRASRYGVRTKQRLHCCVLHASSRIVPQDHNNTLQKYENVYWTLLDS